MTITIDYLYIAMYYIILININNISIHRNPDQNQKKNKSYQSLV